MKLPFSPYSDRSNMVDCQWSVSRIQRGSENVFHANAIKLGVGGALRYSRIFGVSKVEVCFVGKRQRREVVCIYLYGYCVFDVNVSMCYLELVRVRPNNKDTSTPNKI